MMRKFFQSDLKMKKERTELWRAGFTVFAIIMTMIGFIGAQEVDVNYGYQYGEPLIIECKNMEGEWSRGPICTLDNKPLILEYAKDMYHSCYIPIKDKEQYNFIADLIRQNKKWECRVKVNRLDEIYIPFGIPLWGVAEPTHLHIDNHLNFLFHGQDGHVLGAVAYPLRDQFQYISIGSTINLHGVVKWFHRGTFLEMTKDRTEEDVQYFATAALSFLCSSISFAVTMIISISLYDCYLRPRLLRQFKVKKQ